MKFISEKRLVIILVVIIVVGFGFLSYNKFYKPTHKSLHIKIPNFNISGFKLQPETQPETEKVVLNDDVKTLIQNVGKLIELPTDEDPSVATIADISKLKDQAFFVHGKNGDKVLIYAKEKKAIIYRPSINKIIEAGSVEISTGSQQSSGSSGSDSANLANPPISTQRKVLIQEK